MPTKMVLRVSIDDEKSKRRAMTIIAAVEGVESVAVDMKERSITVIGEADPVSVTVKLRKFVSTELLSVGPEKTPEEKQKEEEEAKKKEEEDAKKKEEEEAKKKEEEKKLDPPKVVYLHSSSCEPYPYSVPYPCIVVTEDDNSMCTVC